ncbi:hypothetical protein MASR1M12_30450 [Erysipelotrichia bacterium]
MAKTQLGASTGLEILANIMRHCDAKTNRHIMNGLQKDVPHVVHELRKKIMMFEDLAYADARGVKSFSSSSEPETWRYRAKALRQRFSKILPTICRNVASATSRAK